MEIPSHKHKVNNILLWTPRLRLHSVTEMPVT
uniref:Uncharacterized protein n=1 Tax=Anguilla anguilla TaxID=7936 RepID=A0A0E9RJY2_ANGAN